MWVLGGRDGGLEEYGCCEGWGRWGSGMPKYADGAGIGEYVRWGDHESELVDYG